MNYNIDNFNQNSTHINPSYPVREDITSQIVQSNTNQQNGNKNVNNEFNSYNPINQNIQNNQNINNEFNSYNYNYPINQNTQNNQNINKDIRSQINENQPINHILNLKNSIVPNINENQKSKDSNLLKKKNSNLIYNENKKMTKDLKSLENINKNNNNEISDDKNLPQSKAKYYILCAVICGSLLIYLIYYLAKGTSAPSGSIRTNEVLYLNGNIFTLTYLNVNCDNNTAINYFGLKLDSDRYYYVYNCVNVGNQNNNLIFSQTPESSIQIGPDAVFKSANFLDRHNITCPLNYDINNFVLVKVTNSTIQ